jgi:hypothetical protein
MRDTTFVDFSMWVTTAISQINHALYTPDSIERIDIRARPDAGGVSTITVYIDNGVRWAACGYTDLETIQMPDAEGAIRMDMERLLRDLRTGAPFADRPAEYKDGGDFHA